jgi:hypothetical protein
MSTDSIHAELLEIELILADDRLSDDDRLALYGLNRHLERYSTGRGGSKPHRHSIAWARGL